MNIFKRIGIKIGEAARSIFGRRSYSATRVKKRMKALKRAGVKNNAMKQFETMSKVFKNKKGKSIFSRYLTDEEEDEADDIFETFLSDVTTTIEGIEEAYAEVEQLPGIRKGETNLNEMAHQVDIAHNRERAAFIKNILGSPVIKESWNKYKDLEENSKNVQLMEQALNDVADELSDGQTYNLFSQQQRLDQVIAKYRELKGEGDEDE